MPTTPLVQNPPMTAAPDPAPAPLMTPTQPTTVRALVLVGLAQVVLALLPMFQAKAFDFWSLGTQMIPVVAGILIRLGQGDVQVPKVVNALSLGLLNAANPK